MFSVPSFNALKLLTSYSNLYNVNKRKTVVINEINGIPMKNNKKYAYLSEKNTRETEPQTLANDRLFYEHDDAHMSSGTSV